MIPHDAQTKDLTQQELPEAMDHAVKALCDLKLQMDRLRAGPLANRF